jgi:predicted transcriptional regulator
MDPQIESCTAEAFNAFCQDISGMFEVNMDCKQLEVCDETIAGLKKRFKNMVAVYFAKIRGKKDRTFHLIFDREGLFTLPGIVVMQPKQRILENRKRGAIKDAEDIRDAIQEVGNLLVGSWNRGFQSIGGGHLHFLQTGTFIGLPWDDSAKDIGLAPDKALSFIYYEMTADDYPPFKCGVIFPKDMLDFTSEEAIQEILSPAVKEKQEDIVPPAPAAQEKEVAAPVAETKAAAVPATKEQPVQSSTPEKTVTIPSLRAKDVMNSNVMWGDAEQHSVEQLLAKMQQGGTGYIMIGRDGVPQGIVSRSDLLMATSPYLLPSFSKWRRSLDDASLQIKTKWIMSHPVHTVGTEESLERVIENMCRFGVRALPVVNEQAKVVGLITAFDIFKTLLPKNSSIPCKSVRMPLLTQNQ